MYHVLVIGSGPAGISAALTLQQAGVSVAVTSCMKSHLVGQPLPADLYGIEGLNGEELYLNGVRQAKHAGIDFVEQEITGLSLHDGVFTANGNTPLQATCVILATGRPTPYEVPPFAAPFLEKGVHLQAEQDGFYYRDRMVGVLGGGPYAVSQALLLARSARTVTLFTNDDRLTSVPKSLFVNRYAIQRLDGDHHLKTIVFENQTSLNLDGFFLADRTARAADLCAGVGLRLTNGLVATHADGMTDVSGLFAAGDCTGGTPTLQHKTFDGHRVGLSVAAFLKK